MNMRDIQQVIEELFLEQMLMMQESTLTVRRLRALVAEGFTLEEAYLIYCKELEQLEDDE